MSKQIVLNGWTFTEVPMPEWMKESATDGLVRTRHTARLWLRGLQIQVWDNNTWIIAFDIGPLGRDYIAISGEGLRNIRITYAFRRWISK